MFKLNQMRLGTVANLLVVTIIAGSAGVIYWLRREEPTTIVTTSASYQDLSKTISTTGKVVPVGEFQARAAFPGLVEKIYVSLGDKVAPGQMLIQMKDPFASARVATAKSALESAKAAEENIQNGGSQDERIGLDGDRKQAQIRKGKAESTLLALKKLNQSGAASAAELESAEKEYASASASVEMFDEKSKHRFSRGEQKSAVARVGDAQGLLDAANLQFDNANVTSPIAGTVYLINVLPYDFVPMGAELLHIANLKQVQIRAFFDEPEIGGLAVGQAVEISWDAKPNQVWHGRIKQAPVAAMVMGPRSVGECTITAEDAKGELLPNITVTVKVTTQRRSHVLTVPREALHTEGERHFVYRVVDNRVVQKDVEIGLVNLSRAEITGGLSANDAIALHAINDRALSDGLAVSVAGK